MFLLANNTHRMLIRHDPTIGHMFVPNQTARIPHERGGYIVRTNPQGFRSDIEFAGDPGDRPRILFFGDSITAGDGCYNHERFPELVGDMLDAEVFNYGLSGSGTDQQLLILENYARDVHADLIVLGVTVHNIDRIKAAYRPTLDRVTRRRVLVPKPYFTVDGNGALELHNVPVPIDRPEESEVADRVHQAESHREANPQLKWAYRMADGLRASPHLHRIGRFLSPVSKEDHTALRAFLLRCSNFDPNPDYRDPSSNGARLMKALVDRFLTSVGDVPVLLVPIPDEHYFLTGLEPAYQSFFEDFAASERAVHVADITRPLRNLPFSERRRLFFPYDSHFSPAGNAKVAELIAAEVRAAGLLPERRTGSVRTSVAASRTDGTATHILGISCFYHNSAASLITDGKIVAAAEEERFTRVKADRRFPANAINYCLEQACIDVNELTSIVYYDSTALTFERLLSTALHAGDQGLDLWQRMMPSWSQYKLHVPRLIRRYLKYDGEILQDLHHRSHAASAFYPSPFDKAAILTIDGVGEWATASIGLGESNRVELLKETRFPHSVGLLYSAFTQFIGFRVNDGEYKMMGLAPYGQPEYVEAILEHLIDLKEDGSIEPNMEYFAFLTQAKMTNERFADLFGGPAREQEARITRREMDIARSVQWVTEEAMLRMAREAHRLTGATRLCMAGGVALNCVANGRILREGPFEDIWIQPAAGDSGASLGAALDAYHGYYGKPRRQGGRSIQGGSIFAPGFSQDEVESYLETHGYPYEKLTPEARPQRIAELLDQGKVVGHFAGRGEFGPRALGSRSIIGDPRNQEMQVTLNVKIKYRESFRPFAPVVLAERVGDYFELDRESPYMLLVAPVREDRRLPYDPGDGEDLLEKVRMPRSDLPAITHVDYSARIQTITREDHPEYYDVVKAFEQRTGCAVMVNTSFNVRGEPIINTPEDAYRCFMRTDMDVLALGDCLLLKEAQPPSTEAKGHLDEDVVDTGPADSPVLAPLTDLWRERFLPLAIPWKEQHPAFLLQPFRQSASAWQDHPARNLEQVFSYPDDMLGANTQPERLAAAITGSWENAELGKYLQPLVAELLAIGMEHASEDELVEEVSESIYVMF